MTRYNSAFAVPSGFAVATRTATKGKTTLAQEPAAKSAKAAPGRVRQAPAAMPRIVRREQGSENVPLVFPRSMLGGVDRQLFVCRVCVRGADQG